MQQESQLSIDFIDVYFYILIFKANFLHVPKNLIRLHHVSFKLCLSIESREYEQKPAFMFS